jgi:hypothetical protein
MCLSFAPNTLVASRSRTSIVNTPDIVFKRMGKKAPKKIIYAADLIPIPNQIMAIGIQARGGLGLIISINGVKIILQFFDQPIRIPRGMPIKAALTNPQNTRKRLSRAWRWSR